MTSELFGPRSVTWQVHADPAMWVAGVSALFLQALHPLAVRGVVQLSDFRHDPLGRLRRTASFVSISTYGTAVEAEEAGARVRRIHAALKLRMPDGTQHPVDDPELLRWVHCAEVASYVDVVRRAGFPLSPAHVDLYLTEQRRSAALIGLDPGSVPGTWADITAYIDGMRRELARTKESDEIYDFLTTPPVNPPMRAGWWPVARVAYGLLPPWAIAMYGRPAWSPAQAERRLRALRRTAKLIPDRLRWRVPTGNVLRAIDRLGPAATPSPKNLP